MKLYKVLLVLATEDSATDEETRSTIEHALDGDDFADTLCENLGMFNHRHKLIDQQEISFPDVDHESEDNAAYNKAIDEWYNRSAKECEQILNERR